MARQAHGACLIQYGDTVALCTVTAQDRPTHLPFFPLTVEYRARSYAAGKIPGGFFKREGRPAEQEILAARLIDRPIRPLFPDGFQNETQVMVHVLSADQENDADVLGMIGTSMRTPVDASYLADALVMLRYFESQGAVRQAISVVKKRGGDHERTIREFSLGATGIVVGRPLREFRGVLTGVPILEAGPREPERP